MLPIHAICCSVYKMGRGTGECPSWDTAVRVDDFAHDIPSLGHYVGMCDVAHDGNLGHTRSGAG